MVLWVNGLSKNKCLKDREITRNYFSFSLARKIVYKS